MADVPKQVVLMTCQGKSCWRHMSVQGLHRPRGGKGEPPEGVAFFYSTTCFDCLTSRVFGYVLYATSTHALQLLLALLATLLRPTPAAQSCDPLARKPPPPPLCTAELLPVCC